MCAEGQDVSAVLQWDDDDLLATDNVVNPLHPPVHGPAETSQSLENEWKDKYAVFHTR